MAFWYQMLFNDNAKFAHFNEFPDELLLNVFSFINDLKSLCHTASTCRKWQILAFDPLLIQHLFSKVMSDLANDFKEGKITRENLIKELSIEVRVSSSSPVNAIAIKGKRDSINGLLSGNQIFFAGTEASVLKIWSLAGELLQKKKNLTKSVMAIKCFNGRLIKSFRDNRLEMEYGYKSTTLKGRIGTIATLKIIDQKIISSSWHNPEIKIWDLEGNLVQSLTGHSDGIAALKISKNRIISGSFDNTIKIWALDGTLLHTLKNHKKSVTALKVSDEKIVSGSCDNSLKIWDMKGNLIHTLEGHKNRITSLKIENNRIISSSLDHTIKIWNFEGALLHTLEGHTHVVNNLKIYKKKIVSGSQDNYIKIWSMQGKCLRTIDTGHQYGVIALKVIDGRIVSISQDNGLKIWDFNYKQ